MNQVCASTITITADVVAWYAAVLATFSVLVELHNWWREKPKLKIMAQSGMLMHDPNRVTQVESKWLVIKVRNAGRRPITIDTVEFEPTDGRETSCFLKEQDWRPSSRLEEGCCATMALPEEKLEIDSKRAVVVSDGAGNRWRAEIAKKKA